MAGSFQTVIQVFVEKYSPEEAKKKHIQIARAGLARYLSGQSRPPDIRIETDGASSSTEDTVKPFGIIAYRFNKLREVVEFGLKYAREISPVDSGRYRDSWLPMVNGKPVAVSDIQANDLAIIVNWRPYSRKIHTGARGFERYVPPGIAEKIRQAILAEYSEVIDANVDFMTLNDGWVLRHHLRHIHKGRRYGSPRNDARAGMMITYPSVTLRSVRR